MPSLLAIFATPSNAKRFADHFSIVGLRAKVVQEGNRVSVTTEDAKSFEFVRQMVRDLKEDSRVDNQIARFLVTMRESAVRNTATKIALLDQSTIEVSPDFAQRFLSLHESLTDEARRKMCFVAIESRGSHEKTARFVMNKQ